MSEQKLDADIVQIKIERKRLNEVTGELEDLEPLVIDARELEPRNASD